MKQAHKEIRGKGSKRLRLALLTTMTMVMLLLQACGSNAGGMVLPHQAGQIQRRQGKRPPVTFRQY